MRKILLLLIAFCSFALVSYANPVKGLLERIDKGASKKFIIEQVNSEVDFFELDQKRDKIVVRGNNYVSIATGINWYLKYYAGVHLSWNGMTAKLPEVMPIVKQKERRETSMALRYNLNYCTFSYSMAFWDWERWEREIDWMALHGINLPLAMTGFEAVWYNVLDKLGYTKVEINEFISGSGFMAWWLMNNLEGWGGPNPDSWYEQQIALQKNILKRMKEYGIEPVFPGFSGMMPYSAKEKFGLNVSDPGLWCGFRRPAFLQPTDPRFTEIAELYYAEIDKLFGKANYYSMDPFHEGGGVEGVNLDLAGKAIMNEMKKVNPDAVWVAQAWQVNPREDMIKNLKNEDMVILDLTSPCRPQWGEKESVWARPNGFGHHNWLYCTVLAFGGKVGLHGKISHVIDSFYKAKNDDRFGKTLKGVGLVMESIENNPIMFELMTELPWRAEKFSKDEWVKNYLFARYGKHDVTLEKAWTLLSNSIYNSPPASIQLGAHESIFCSRPTLDSHRLPCWAGSMEFYDPQDVFDAANLMVSVADKFKGNNNFEYDLVDVVRQAIADKGRLLQEVVTASYHAQDKTLFELSSKKFLDLLLLQDELLGTRSEFMVGSWINQARSLGNTPEEKNLYEWNARVQITTWGNRVTAEEAGLRDYAEKEWNGILKDYYYISWAKYFDFLSKKMNGENPEEIDFYLIGEAWSREHKSFPSEPQGECVETVKRIFEAVFD